MGSLSGGDTLFHWDGASWTDVEPPAGLGDFGPLWPAAPNDVWLVGVPRQQQVCDEHQLFHWDGASWSKAATFDWVPKSMWGSGRSDVWVVGGGRKS